MLRRGASKRLQFRSLEVPAVVPMPSDLSQYLVLPSNHEQTPFQHSTSTSPSPVAVSISTSGISPNSNQFELNPVSLSFQPTMRCSFQIVNARHSEAFNLTDNLPNHLPQPSTQTDLPDCAPFPSDSIFLAAGPSRNNSTTTMLAMENVAVSALLEIYSQTLSSSVSASK